MTLSVILPTYNRQGVLARALNSVVEQGDTDIEIIVIDDASTDTTAQWLSQQELPGLRIITLPTNQGVNAARNAGIAAARGTWVILLDSDDQLAPKALASIRTAIAHTKTSWILGRCVTTEGVSTVQDSTRHGVVSYTDYLAGAITGEYLAVVRTEVVRRYPFIETLRGGEYLTWQELAKAGLGPEVIDAVWRIYDTTGDDRLSIKKKNYARLAAIFQYDLRTKWYEYWRIYPPRLAQTVLRAAYYTLMSLWYRS